MKKTLRVLTASILSCLVLASTASAYAPIGNVTTPKATPTIDGTINEGEWPEAGHLVLNSDTWTADGWLGEVTATVDLYTAWDKDNFYIGGKVKDPTFCYTDNAGAYNGDAFQVSLNIDNIFKSDEYDRAVFYSWGLMEDGNISVQLNESADNHLMENVGKGHKTDDGWEFEVALSLTALSEDASLKANQDAIIEPGMPIGGLFCYLDRDTDTPNGVINAFGTFTEADVADWGPDGHGITFVFAENEPETEPETTTPDTTATEETVEPSAPQTFDVAVIAAVAAIVSAAGYAVAKKH